jgi:hypothetical protein
VRQGSSLKLTQIAPTPLPSMEHATATHVQMAMTSRCTRSV